MADALFTPVQQRVLGLLFGQPERSFQSAEIIRLARSGTGAAHRFLTRLAASGLVSVTARGNQKHYQANRDAPIFSELHGLALKTSGITAPLTDALKPRARQIVASFVYGSTAAGTSIASSDVDLLVISDRLRYPDLITLLEPAERVIGRTINPTVMKRAEWRMKRSRNESFAARIASGPKLFVLGSENDL